MMKSELFSVSLHLNQDTFNTSTTIPKVQYCRSTAGSAVFALQQRAQIATSTRATLTAAVPPVQFAHHVSFIYRQQRRPKRPCDFQIRNPVSRT
jgi:hypothetical protein